VRSEKLRLKIEFEINGIAGFSLRLTRLHWGLRQNKIDAN